MGDFGSGPGYASTLFDGGKSLADRLSEREGAVVQFAKNYQAERQSYHAAIVQFDVEREALAAETARLNDVMAELDGYIPRAEQLKSLLAAYAASEDEKKKIVTEGVSGVRGVVYEDKTPYEKLESAVADLEAVGARTDVTKGRITDEQQSLANLVKDIAADRAKQADELSHIGVRQRGYAALKGIYEKLISRSDADLHETGLRTLGFTDDDDSSKSPGVGGSPGDDPGDGGSGGSPKGGSPADGPKGGSPGDGFFDLPSHYEHGPFCEASLATGTNSLDPAAGRDSHDAFAGTRFVDGVDGIGGMNHSGSAAGRGADKPATDAGYPDTSEFRQQDAGRSDTFPRHHRMMTADPPFVFPAPVAPRRRRGLSRLWKGSD